VDSDDFNILASNFGVSLAADPALRRGGRFGAIKSPFADAVIPPPSHDSGADDVLQGLLG